jgi:hypothetical protein
VPPAPDRQRFAPALYVICAAEGAAEDAADDGADGAADDAAGDAADDAADGAVDDDAGDATGDFEELHATSANPVNEAIKATLKLL